MPVAAFSSYPWMQTFELGVAGCLRVHSIMSAICNQSTCLLYSMCFLCILPLNFEERLQVARTTCNLRAYILNKKSGGVSMLLTQALEHSMPTPAYITASIHIPLEHRYLCVY